MPRPPGVLYTAASHTPTQQQGWGNYSESIRRQALCRRMLRPLDAARVPAGRSVAHPVVQPGPRSHFVTPAALAPDRPRLTKDAPPPSFPITTPRACPPSHSPRRGHASPIAPSAPNPSHSPPLYQAAQRRGVPSGSTTRSGMSTTLARRCRHKLLRDESGQTARIDRSVKMNVRHVPKHQGRAGAGVGGGAAGQRIYTY